MLSLLYFVSQLCTYTPGIIFYNCGNFNSVGNIGTNGKVNVMMKNESNPSALQFKDVEMLLADEAKTPESFNSFNSSDTLNGSRTEDIEPSSSFVISKEEEIENVKDESPEISVSVETYSPPDPQSIYSQRVRNIQR